MAETHINAYFADVDEKQKAFEYAAAELQAARDRLETKKKEVGYVEPEVDKTEEVVTNEQTKTSQDSKRK